MTDSPAAIPFRHAVRFWLLLGFISFGGPAGQLALMHRELVERQRWISERRFLHALNYCMLLPGPEAQQLATYLGWLMHRTWGGVLAGVLFVLPSLLILIGLSWLYLQFGDQSLLAALFYGIKPAVTAIVVHAAHRIGSRTLRNGWLWALAIAAFVALVAAELPFPLIVLMAAAIGWLLGRYRPGLMNGAGHAAADTGPDDQAVIGDHTPIPEHARFRSSRLLRLLVIGAGLWLLPMAMLAAVFGWQGTLTQMGAFFTQAALVTFGGAYAVLPYLADMAVNHFHWLTTPQMMDGLALGESTPGPLIMVVAFVAFLGAQTHQVFGPDQLFLAGVAGACVATWFTFLPSFLFILAGGPLVESTHGRLGFTAPLTGISAAVVGVIASLALFFGYHVLWPQGLDAGLVSGLDWQALLLMVLAMIALFVLKRGVIEVLLVCGLAGMLLGG